MECIVLRHGQTLGNVQRRYVGSTDESLSEAGLAMARALGNALVQPSPDTGAWVDADAGADAGACEPENKGSSICPTVVYVSPLARARQTAAAVFPQARQCVVPGFAEMDFGVFEGRTADEMVDDLAYTAWVDAWCEDACPGGESRSGFAARTARAFRELACAVAARGEDELVIVAHGGTVMAIMSEFVEPACARPYFDWHVANCEGYRADLRFDGGDPILSNPSLWPGDLLSAWQDADRGGNAS